MNRFTGSTFKHKKNTTPIPLCSMNILVEIYFPIVTDFEFEKFPFEQKEIVINEISEVLSNNSFDLENHIQSYSFQTTIEEPNSNIIIHNPSDQVLFGLNGLERSLKIKIDLVVDLSLYKIRTNKEGKNSLITDKDELLVFLPYNLSQQFGDIMFEVILLSQVARPGSLKLRDGVIYINGKIQFEFIQTFDLYREQLEHQREIGYPTIEYIELTKFYNWIIDNDLLFNVNTANSYQKALNNLSYINKKESEISQFSYQMRALEDIYTDGIFQIAEQLNTKIQLFLGPIEAFKKQIKKMYDIRSRFSHGDINVIPFHKKKYLLDSSEKNYEDEIYEASTLSLILIISTLQKMYKENKLNLDFGYDIR